MGLPNENHFGNSVFSVLCFYQQIKYKQTNHKISKLKMQQVFYFNCTGYKSKHQIPNLLVSTAVCEEEAVLKREARTAAHDVCFTQVQVECHRVHSRQQHGN